MTANTNRFSTYTNASAGAGPDGKNADPKKELWTSMLDSVKASSGKSLPQKNLLVLGTAASAHGRVCSC